MITWDAQGVNEVLETMKKLEESQKAFADQILRDLRLLVKSPGFSKYQALDYLLNNRMVNKESNQLFLFFILEGSWWSHASSRTVFSLASICALPDCLSYASPRSWFLEAPPRKGRFLSGNPEQSKQ